MGCDGASGNAGGAYLIVATMIRYLVICGIAVAVLLTSFAARSAPAAGLEPPRFAGMVEAHNDARRAIGEAGLIWSAELAGTAQGWASRLGSEGCAMRHSGTPGLGENLFWASGWRPSASQVVSTWLQEVRNYNRTTGGCFPGTVCGHYTQVVWRSTKFVGCGMAACGATQVWVCNYSPPGNVVGQRPY